MKLQALLATPALLGFAAIAAFSTLAEPRFAQEPQDPADPPMWDLGVTKRNKVLYEALQGGWALTEHKQPGVPESESETRGYLVITDGFLSLELHGLRRNGHFQDRVFHTGTHAFDLNNLGQLVLTSLIGTLSLNEDLPVDFERPGFQRLYRVVHTGETLQLTRLDDQSKLSFRRLKPQKTGGRDFYGREVEVDEE